ncbi:MAG: nitroreductase family protein, partial [Nevskia sp.]|nr:nitroreductase family protein [Nevskia sp.]
AGARQQQRAGGAAWTHAAGSMAEYGDYSRRLRAMAGTPGLRDVIRCATLAANGHNTQPWRFRPTDGAIGISPDFSRRTPVVDPDDHHLYVSLGCAAENLRIAACASWQPGELEVAADALRFRFSAGSVRPDPLYPAIFRRQSTRSVYDGRPVDAADLDTLHRAAATPGVDLALITERRTISQVRDLVMAGNDRQMGSPDFNRELKQWVRFNPGSAMASGDGLFSAASGNPIVPPGLGSLAYDVFVSARRESQRYAQQIDSSPGLAVFAGAQADASHWINVGRAVQRFALAATSLGLKCAFINQPVEVPELRPELAALIGVPGRRPDILMRFGYAAELPFAPRRPVEAVLLA